MLRTPELCSFYFNYPTYIYVLILNVHPVFGCSNCVLQEVSANVELVLISAEM